MRFLIPIFCFLSLGAGQDFLSLFGNPTDKLTQGLSRLQNITQGLASEKFKLFSKRDAPQNDSDEKGATTESNPKESVISSLISRLQNHMEKKISFLSKRDVQSNEVEDIVGDVSDEQSSENEQQLHPYEVHDSSSDELSQIDIKPECQNAEMLQCMLHVANYIGENDFEDSNQFCNDFEKNFGCMIAIVNHCLDDEAKEETLTHITPMLTSVKEMCSDATTEETIEKEENESVLDCLGGEQGVADIIQECQSIAVEKMKENILVFLVHGLSVDDITCLAYHHMSSCAAHKSAEKCGDEIGRGIYAALTEEYPEEFQSEYCSSNNEDSQTVEGEQEREQK